jgi:hypothetical protein
MPHKANDSRRHKFPKARYRIKNWPAYDAALRDRGDLTVWVTPEALAAWHPRRVVDAVDRRDTRIWQSRPGCCCAWRSAGPGDRPAALGRATDEPGDRHSGPHHAVAPQRGGVAGCGASQGERAQCTLSSTAPG